MKKTFRDLKVWQKSHALILKRHRITRQFLSEEKSGIISQLRRTASSILINIVKGFKKRSTKEHNYFSDIADSFLEEAKYHLILSADLKYTAEKDFEKIEGSHNEINRMLNVLQNKT